MGMNQQPRPMIPQMFSLLEQMDVCAQELEAIAKQEYAAIRSLDAARIIQCGKQREISHQHLVQLEQQSRQLLAQHQVSSQLPLSSVIDMYADEQSTALQALRRNLFERMLRVDQKMQENRMRLHAAYSVSTTILQKLGLIQVEQTYHRRATG